MDNLPKDDQKEGDLSTFAGSYPEDKQQSTSAGAAPPPPPPPVDQKPGSASPFGSAPDPTTPAPPVTQPPPAPPAIETPIETKPPTVASETDSTRPAFSVEPVEAEVTPTPPAQPTPAAADQGASPPDPTAEENPFVVPSTSESPKTGGGLGGLKRWLIIAVLIIALIGIGFVAFQIVGQMITSRQPTVLTYWGLWESQELLVPAISEYTRLHPNIAIEYSKYSPKNYRERLEAAIDRDEGPDIFRFHNTWMPMLADNLAPAEKTGYSAADFQQTFYPVAVKDLVISNKAYGVPLMIDGLGLYYNEDLLRAGGVNPPTTWEDFRNAALSLTVKDEGGKIITAGAALGTTNNVEHFSDIIALMFLQNGANLKNPVTKEAQDALSFYHLFAEKPNHVWESTLDNSILAFAGGKVAMIFAPSWQVFTIRQTNPELQFQIIPVPQLPGTNTTWASYWVEGVSAKSDHVDEAWEFLQYLSSKETMITLYSEAAKVREFGEPYSRIDLAQTIINDPFVGAYISQAQTAQTFFLASRTYDNGINDRMIKYLEDAVSSMDKGVSPQAAVETMAQGFSQVLRNFGYSVSTSSS